MGEDRQRLLDREHRIVGGRRRLLCLQGGAALALALRGDRVGATGVLVNAVLPGDVETDMWVGEQTVAKRLGAAEGLDPETILATAASQTLSDRLGTAVEIAAVIAFLCSDSSWNVVGSAWRVDGGAVRTMY